MNERNEGIKAGKEMVDLENKLNEMGTHLDRVGVPGPNDMSLLGRITSVERSIDSVKTWFSALAIAFSVVFGISWLNIGAKINEAVTSKLNDDANSMILKESQKRAMEAESRSQTGLLEITRLLKQAQADATSLAQLKDAKQEWDNMHEAISVLAGHPTIEVATVGRIAIKDITDKYGLVWELEFTFNREVDFVFRGLEQAFEGDVGTRGSYFMNVQGPSKTWTMHILPAESIEKDDPEALEKKERLIAKMKAKVEGPHAIQTSIVGIQLPRPSTPTAE